MKKIAVIYSKSEGEALSSVPRLEEDLTDNVREIEGILKGAGFSVSVIPLKNKNTLDQFIRRLKDASDSLIFNLCEEAFGHSSFEMNVAALLELYGLKFTGSGPLTLGLALDKGLSKDVLASRDIMTPEHWVFRDPPERLKKNLKFPLIVKPLREDASVGIDAGAVVNRMKDFRKRVEYVIKEFGQPAIAEEYVDGREFNIAVLGNGRDRFALPPAELLFVDFPDNQPKICSYEAKWVPGSPLYKKTVPECPADIPASLRDELTQTALKAYEVMGCRDYARVDVRLGEDGNIRVLEVNPNPDISPDAGLARAARAEGLDYRGLILKIVEIAAARYEGEGLEPGAVSLGSV